MRNTEELIASLEEAITEEQDDSLSAAGVSPEQALADLERLGELIHSRQPEQETELEHFICLTSGPTHDVRVNRRVLPTA